MKPASHANETHERNRLLKEFFVRQGLKLEDIWEPTPGNQELENAQLCELSRWVCAYGACPDRKKLEKEGYVYPPVDPCIDPETDWIRFERWMKGQPLSWSLPDQFYRCGDPAKLDDDEAAEWLKQVIGYLAERNVFVEFVGELPDRIALEYLLRIAREQPFEFSGDNSITHLTGCTCWCEECFQRPWCKMADEFMEDS